jgi:hypothetical protein
MEESAISSSNFSFSTIDALVADIDAGEFYSHIELSQYLTDQCVTQHEKVRSIYTWIATNISYDKQFLHEGQSRNTQLADAVWDNRLAVCEGYAILFNSMCRASGIESRLIKGYVREFMDLELKLPNHAWNSVKIDGKWHLLDVTWASVNAESLHRNEAANNGLKTKYKLDHFFLVDPEKMIVTHLPEDPYWQLQFNTIDLDTFLDGELAVLGHLNKIIDSKPVDFEMLISDYENLDSLDRSIAYLERMVCSSESAKAYGLGVAYYYKAQDILKEAHQNEPSDFQEFKEQARTFYQLSLEYLSLLEEDDYGYDFSKDLAGNVLFRMEVLQ